MICPRCQNQVEEGGKFCPFCGMNMAEAAAAAAAVAAAPVQEAVRMNL